MASIHQERVEGIAAEIARLQQLAAAEEAAYAEICKAHTARHVAADAVHEQVIAALNEKIAVAGISTIGV